MTGEGSSEFRSEIGLEPRPLSHDDLSAAEFVDVFAGPEGGFSDGGDNTQSRWLVRMMVMPRPHELDDPTTRQHMQDLYRRLGTAWRFGEEG